MRIITGDETGLLKDVWLEDNTAGVLGGTLLQERSEGVTSMSWAPPSSSGASRMVCSRVSGVVETWESDRAPGSGAAGWRVVASARGLPSAPVAVCALPQLDGGHVAFCRGGDVCVTGPGSASAGDRGRFASVPTLKRAAKTRAEGGDAAAGQQQADEVGEDVMRSRNWRATGRLLSEHKVSCGAVDAAGRVALAGGMEHDACLLDLATGAVTWQAKNVAQDHLQLRQPVWVSAAAFLRGGGGGGSDGSGGGGDNGGSCFAVGTAFKQLRLYDARAETRRPVAQVQEVGDFGVTALALLADGTRAVVGDKGGGLHAWDLRRLNAPVAKFAGNMGSVRSLGLHPTLPYLASAGLDRTARVFSLKTGKLVHTSYLKQRLGAVLFDPEGVQRPPAQGEGEGGGSESEESEESDDDEGAVEYYEDGGAPLSGGEEGSIDEDGGGKKDEDDEQDKERLKTLGGQDEDEEDDDDKGGGGKGDEEGVGDSEESDEEPPSSKAKRVAPKSTAKGPSESSKRRK